MKAGVVAVGGPKGARGRFAKAVAITPPSSSPKREQESQ